MYSLEMLSFPNANIFNSPKFLSGIVDAELRKWALNLTSLWKSLGRKVRINSTFKDVFNSDCKHYLKIFGIEELNLIML